MPGMPPMPGMPKPGSAKKAKQGKGAKKSGNPAKRAAIEAGLDSPTDAAPSNTLTELPSAFKDFLG